MHAILRYTHNYVCASPVAFWYGAKVCTFRMPVAVWKPLPVRKLLLRTCWVEFVVVPGAMAALRAVPYHTTLYENLFLLRLSICFNETPVAADRCGERELLTWKPHSSSSVSIAVESCAT